MSANLLYNGNCVANSTSLTINDSTVFWRPLYVLRVLKLKTFPFLNIRFLLIIYWYFKNSADSSRWNINCIFQIAYTFFKFLLTTAIFEILQNWTNFYLLKTDFVVKLLNYEMRYTLLDCVSIYFLVFILKN